MAFHPTSVTVPHIAYLSLGGFVVLFGMFSLFLREKLYVGEACWAFIFGIIIGPYGANIFNPRSWAAGSDEEINEITLEFTRVVLAIGVFAIGVELPKAYMARHWKSLFFLLVPVMTWGWFVSAGLIYAFIPGLTFLSSLAVAACLTPTDPILAAAVVGGKWADKHVPAHIRHLLAAESGCNDGAAFPFLYIALYLILDASTGAAVRDWFLLLWLYQVVLGTVIGALLGFGFRHLMKFCQRHDLIDRHSYVAQYVSLAILTVGVCTLIGADDLLAAFACGTAFAWDGFFNRQTEESVFSSVIDLLFNVAAFVFIGAWMPFNKFHDAALHLSVWRLVVVAILVLLLKRLPVMVMVYKLVPDIKTFREALFTGHFGPVGVGAIFISTLATKLIEDTNERSHEAEVLATVMQPIVAFIVLCSIIIHGLSIPSFSLGRRVHSVSRSVSRTWSRHAAAPDWTTQARLVERGGADIVINRDSQMEEGKLNSDEKMADSGRASAITMMDKSPEDKGGSETKAEGSDIDMKQEFPPDGTERVMEWHEGAHKVIEKRRAPGDDVEVEVQDEDNPQYPGRRSSHWSFRSTAGGGKHEDEDAAVKKMEEDSARDSGDARKYGLPSPVTARTREKMADEQGDEDWASDDSHNVPSSSVRQEPSRFDPKRRPKSAGSEAVGAKGGPFGFKRKARYPLRRTYSQPIENYPDYEARGRSGDNLSRHPNGTGMRHQRDSSLRHGIGEGYPQNQQIGRIHALARTRESSPSRSVRFTDDNISRPSTGTRSLAVSQVDLGDEDSEFPRSRLGMGAFSVPFGPSDASPGGNGAIGRNSGNHT